MREKSIGRSAASYLIAGVLAVGVSGCCNTPKVAAIPPPEGGCPTIADLDLLDEWLPVARDVQAALEMDDVMGRFINAAAYCETAAERLR